VATHDPIFEELDFVDEIINIKNGIFVSSILLSNEIIIYLFVQIILFILLFIAFYFSISIIKNWDYEKTSTKQYKLEKTSI
jgi:hypothetical protein